MADSLKSAFHTNFRRLIRERCRVVPCETLAFHTRECQGILLANEKGIDSLLVREIFQIFLEECQAECLARIEEIGDMEHNL